MSRPIIMIDHVEIINPNPEKLINNLKLLMPVELVDKSSDNKLFKVFCGKITKSSEQPVLIIIREKTASDAKWGFYVDSINKLILLVKKLAKAGDNIRIVDDIDEGENYRLIKINICGSVFHFVERPMTFSEMRSNKTKNL